MNCEEIREQISPLLDGQLDAGRAEAVRAHLAGCEACRKHMADIEVTCKGLQALGKLIAPADLKARVQARLKAEIQNRPASFRAWWRQPLFLARVAAVLVVGLLVGMFWATQVGPNGDSAVSAPDTASREKRDVLQDPELAAPGEDKADPVWKSVPGKAAGKGAGMKEDRDAPETESLDDSIAAAVPEANAFRDLEESPRMGKAEGYRADEKKAGFVGGAEAAPAAEEVKRKEYGADMRGQAPAAEPQARFAPPAPQAIAAKPGAPAALRQTGQAGENLALAATAEKDGAKQLQAEAGVMDKAGNTGLIELRVLSGDTEQTLRFLDNLLASADKPESKPLRARAGRAAGDGAAVPAAPVPDPRAEVQTDAGPAEPSKALIAGAAQREAELKKTDSQNEPAQEKTAVAAEAMRRTAKARPEASLPEIRLTRRQYEQLTAYVKELTLQPAPIKSQAKGETTPAPDAALKDAAVEKAEQTLEAGTPPAESPAYTLLRIRIIDEIPAADQ